MKSGRRMQCAAALLAIPAIVIGQTCAQTAKPVTIIVGFAQGSGANESSGGAGGTARQPMRPDPAYDQFTSLLGHRLGAFLPGAPSVTIRYMPGAGSLTAIEYIAREAPHDGSVAALVGASALRDLAMRDPVGSIDPVALTWIGGFARENYACAIRSNSGVKSLADLRGGTYFFGAVDPNSRSFRHANALAILGAPVRIVSGYADLDEIISNLPKRELDGVCGWALSSIKNRYADWLADSRLRIIVQFAADRDPRFAYAPTGAEAAVDALSRPVLDLLDQEGFYAWPLIAPPGLSVQTAFDWRGAFANMLKDPEALVEAAMAGLEPDPVSGADLAAAMQALRDAAPGVKDRLRRLSAR